LKRASLKEAAAWDSIEKIVRALNQTTIAKSNEDEVSKSVDFVLCLLCCVATRVFSVRLLHAVAFSK